MPNFHHNTLIYNVTGQVIEWYPPASEVLRDGAPAAASYRAFAGTQSNDDTPKIALASATLESTSLTISSASGYSQTNRNRFNISTTTGAVIGRRYLASNASGQREVVVPSAVGSNYIDVDEPLAYDFAVSDTFVALRQTFSIPNAFIQDSTNINVWAGWRSAGGGRTLLTDVGGTNTQAPPYRVEWQYTLGGTPRRDWTTFDVERRQAKANLSIQELREIAPDVAFFEWIVQRGQDFAPQLVAAERDVYVDTRTAGYDPDSITDPQIWNRIVLQKWLVIIGKAMLFNSGGKPVSDWLKMTMDDYQKLFQDAIGTACRVWIDTGSTGAITPDPARQMWLRGR